MVNATLNGAGPYPFVIDTGAAISGINDHLARLLGWRPIGRISLNGSDFPTYTAQDVTIGALRQNNVAFFGIDDPNLQGEGLFAAGLITSLVSELDFTNQEWRVHPKGAAPPAGYVPTAGQLNASGEGFSKRIYADVVLDGVPLRPVWDTGGPRQLVLSHAQAERIGYLEPETPYAPVGGGGITGPAKQPFRLVRAHALQVGPFRYPDVLVMVRAAGAGGEDAVLGLPVLQTLDLFVDGPSGRLWTRRNQRAAAGGQTYSPSGLWVEEAGRELIVSDVGVGSPAALAGVRRGDIIEGFGDLRTAVKRLAGPIGAPIFLRLRRPDGPMTAQFNLAAYL